ncbi:MAG: HAMP domain-containing protein [Betaproteobacteria bacterium]|nr:MAG: HAMP domain-containing protein [Betaproteobacteria bacterium]
MRSIRRQLLVWLLAGLLLGVAVAAVGTYLRARQEANALFDHQLQEMVASLTDAPFAAAPAGASGNGAADDALVVQIWDRNGMQLYLSQPQRVLPQHAQLGFTNLRTESGEWRVFSALTGSQVVQVAQPMRARRELAASMALRTIVPLLAVLPALGLLIWFIIARGLEPLERVAAAVGRRSPTQLEPLAERGLPGEVQPLVRALNGLLERLGKALTVQRTFIADAAHELRTPLTAVHLQAQLAERAATDAERRKALADLKSGLERATRLSEQLLTLARTEPGVDAVERPEALVDLSTLAREVIAELAPLAAEKAVDLGLSEGGKAVVRGDAEALRTLLSNLIDNAVRYTPSNGRVDITVQPEDDRVALAVRDNGPGIAPAERARVFDRFYRGQSASTPQAAQRASTRGSGLGLAIVKRIADRHGAETALGEGLDGRGLGVTVRFPAAAT